WVLPLLFAGVLFPLVAREKEKYNEEQMLAFMRSLFLVSLLAGLLAWLLAPWLIPFVFGEAYDRSVPVFRLLLPGYILFCPTIVLAAWFSGRGRPGVNLVGSSICFACILALDILLVPGRGMEGASIASSIGYTLSSVWFVAVYCVRTQTPLQRLWLFRQSDWQYIRQSIQKAGLKKTR
ncbi:MAG: polysaccharide biosynthesis C-terminal domain-containing protein, partial [Bacteroidetes bacterium]|nr:polysaccharide biosynthesis C-terminal domain-containing protein [Bacteroidota bacterium]